MTFVILVHRWRQSYAKKGTHQKQKQKKKQTSMIKGKNEKVNMTKDKNLKKKTTRLIKS